MMQRFTYCFTILALVVTTVLSVPARGIAQPADAPAPAPADDAPAPAPADDAPAPADDAPAVYDAAFAALLAGHLDAAQRGFSDAAARIADPELRAAARELARLAMTLQEQHIRLVAEAGAAPPSALPREPAATPDYRDAEDRTAGRTSFVISTTLASVYGGIVLVDLLDLSDGFRPTVATVLGATGVGFLGSYYGTRGAHITEAMADAYSAGLGLGVGNALLLAVPLGLNDSSEQFQGVALGGLVLGGAAGLVLADRVRPTRGQVQIATLGSSLGIATTGLGLLITQPDDIETDTLLLLLAGGLDAGLVGGMVMAPRLDWSLSRTRLVSLGGFLGALVGWSGAALLTGTDVDADIGTLWGVTTLAGLWSGVGLAAHLTRDMAPDRRFQTQGGLTSSAMITPAAIPNGMGLALSGSF